jgi:LPXTG-motif cell wall-anchored protein
VPAERRADTSPTYPVELAAYAKVAVAPAPKAIAPRAFAPAGPNGVILPKTATDAELRLWVGLLLCSVGLVIVLIRRRRRSAVGLTTS